MRGQLHTVERFARDERLFRRVKRVLVAVSGGPDSLAAMVLLRELGQRAGFDIVVAHFDHQLRPASAGDMDFVRETCKSLDIQCFTGEGDVREARGLRRMGLEEAARRMRYQFLAFVAGKQEANAIATGHTADDQAETVLQRIVRGSGVRGIRGMLPRTTVPGSEAHTLIRPLLPLTRVDTLAVCEAAGITPRVDETNADRSHLRNRLRHDVLPYLRELNPSLDRSLLGLAASARELFESVEDQAMACQPHTRNELGSIFATSALASLPAEAITLVVEREALFSRVEPEVNRTRLRNLGDVLTKGSGLVAFGDTIVEASAGHVRVGPALQEVEPFEPRVLNIPGISVAGPLRVEVSTEKLDARPGEHVATVSMTKLKGAMRARPAQPGDRLKVLKGGPRLADVFTNAKVPRWEREGAIVVADGEGIVAVAGGSLRLPEVPDDEALWLRFGRQAQA